MRELVAVGVLVAGALGAAGVAWWSGAMGVGPLPPHRVSQHFTKAEATKSDTAKALGWDNQPTTERMWSRLRFTFGRVMEPIRELHGGAIRVNSAFRSDRLNSRVGGVPDSKHRRGFAVDFQPVKGSAEALFYRIVESGLLESLPIDKLLYYPVKGHIHVGVRTKGARHLAGLSRPGEKVQWLS